MESDEWGTAVTWATSTISSAASDSQPSSVMTAQKSSTPGWGQEGPWVDTTLTNTAACMEDSSTPQSVSLFNSPPAPVDPEVIAKARQRIEELLSKNSVIAAARLVHGHALESEFKPKVLLRRILDMKDFQNAGKCASLFTKPGSYGLVFQAVDAAAADGNLKVALDILVLHRLSKTQKLTALGLVQQLVQQDDLSNAVRYVEQLGGLMTQYDVGVQHALIRQIMDKRQYGHALRIAKYSSSGLAYLLRELLERGLEREARYFSLDCGIARNAFQQLKLPQYKLPSVCPVHWIGTGADLPLAYELLVARKPEVVGFDIEYRPTFRAGDWSPVEIIQLATDTEVCLVDAQLLNKNPLYAALMGELLSSKDIRKLGCGMKDDVRRLVSSHSSLKCYNELHNVTNVSDAFVAAYPGLERGALKRMAAYVLGKGLSKSCQTSNWAQRPLTDKQIAYAACDAMVLVDIYRAMEAERADCFERFTV
eukprot:TRINITY_DN9758_c0_g1_i1.p1 TRINITY_DN9758_c0_g1~~TRINITY_DN9758_c0_g1_i1.p1  ORF type:complete len:480 (-),score=108.40 TRINITY_DN9758_c0_g1_i1:28-1467(-)